MSDKCTTVYSFRCKERHSKSVDYCPYCRITELEDRIKGDTIAHDGLVQMLEQAEGEVERLKTERQSLMDNCQVAGLELWQRAFKEKEAENKRLMAELKKITKVEHKRIWPNPVCREGCPVCIAEQALQGDKGEVI